MMRFKRRFMIAALLLTNSFANMIALAGQNPSSDDIVTAIKQLASPNPSERVVASERLRRFGNKSVPPLISLLKDFISKPVPGYIGLREKAAMSVLAKLKAQEAVPIFIELMWCCEFEVAGRDSLLDSMAGLIELGPVAIPELIKAIEGAEERANRISPLRPAWNTEAEKKARLSILKLLFQRRAIKVIGLIGDKEALPFLERIRKTSGSEYLNSYIENAIRSVKR